MATADVIQVGLGAVNLLAIIALVGVTIWYATSTKDLAKAAQKQLDGLKDSLNVQSRQTDEVARQANATKQLVLLDQARRHDSIMPIILIEGNPPTRLDWSDEARPLIARAEHSLFPPVVDVKLRNIGPGPALAVIVSLHQDNAEVARKTTLPLVAPGQGTEVMDLHSPVQGTLGQQPLSNEEVGRHIVHVKASYRDVFGRRFISNVEYRRENDYWRSVAFTISLPQLEES